MPDNRKMRYERLYKEIPDNRKMRYERLYKELDDSSKETLPAELEGLIQRTQQKSPPAYGLRDHIDDGLYKKGIGRGSAMTQISEDRATARAQLIKFVQNKKNIQAFQSLPPEQKRGIQSLIRGY